MKSADQIKPICNLKAHDEKIVRGLSENNALLKILALASRQIEEGKVQPAADVISRIRNQR